MILVDTSVWVDHLRRGDDALGAALEASIVVTHPWVIGELALGPLRNRHEVLHLLGQLSAAHEASHGETLELVERRSLAGRGIGYVDLHLLASAALSGVPLWTRDRRLAEVAGELGLAYGESG